MHRCLNQRRHVKRMPKLGAAHDSCDTMLAADWVGVTWCSEGNGTGTSAPPIGVPSNDSNLRRCFQQILRAFQCSQRGAHCRLGHRTKDDDEAPEPQASLLLQQEDDVVQAVNVNVTDGHINNRTAHRKGILPKPDVAWSKLSQHGVRRIKHDAAHNKFTLAFPSTRCNRLIHRRITITIREIPHRSMIKKDTVDRLCTRYW
mmetsp:Transcript_10880/g.34579  ORF Transcript_10880/g.34579 Transcript_10880/m.34579 type:complete len:202 (+) Transcript_10880:1490-2095(+)